MKALLKMKTEDTGELYIHDVLIGKFDRQGSFDFWYDFMFEGEGYALNIFEYRSGGFEASIFPEDSVFSLCHATIDWSECE